MTVPPKPSALIVDDDRSTRMILSNELLAAGYRPVEARSGAEAVAALAADRYRIVLTDWLMPDVDGLELCRRIRRDPALSGTYVIMITINSDKPRLITAFEAGVDDFLPKPIEPGVLMARMRAACRTVDLQDALLSRNAELESANRRLQELATTDELTGLANRRHGIARLGEHWNDATRHGQPLAVALVDIDHFKKLNDTYGHAIGDRVLTDVAEVLRCSCRSGDTVCRYGGEEFLCVLPETGAADAAELADRLRDAIARHRTTEGPLSLAVSASIGLAVSAPTHRAGSDLVRAADDALYAAKEGGRNAVRFAA
jgi:two-component system, cell cycle response regulator